MSLRSEARQEEGNMKPVITDHAVLRYMDRVLGFDIEEVRDRIASEIGTVSLDVKRLHKDNVSYVLAEGYVKTVYI